MLATSAIVLTRSGAVDWHVQAWPMRSSASFGLGLLPHALGAVVMTSVDRFALSGTVGPASTGNYFAALQIASIISAVASALNSAWIPWLYERLGRGDHASKLQVVHATYALCALMLAAAGTMALLAPIIVRIVAGPGFEQAGHLLVLLAPAAAFSGMYYLSAAYLFYSRRTRTLSMVTISTAIVQTGLTFVLATIAGAAGVAIATLLSAILYALTTSIVAQRLIPMPWAPWVKTSVQQP
jgi:O-antigen/teichoic acid export membrane protein